MFWSSTNPISGGARSISCGNVTISNSKDAEEVGKTYKAITGNLIFSSDSSGSISLDGVEQVEGNISYRDGYPSEECVIPPQFDISCPNFT